MAGATPADFNASQQLFFIGEDIYNKLQKACDKPTGKSAMSEEEKSKFWNTNNQGDHNSTFGIKVYLMHLEKFHATCGSRKGKYTATGTTVGECKLFASLHACVLCKADVLNDFPGVKGFYTTFLNLPKTQDIVNTGGNFGCKFGQYFLGPGQSA